MTRYKISKDEEGWTVLMLAKDGIWDVVETFANRKRALIELRAIRDLPDRFDSRTADRIDGYDRDDLGESPDF